MILAPKHLLLTRMATLGRLSLRRRPLPVAKAGRCVNHARNALVRSPGLFGDRKRQLPTRLTIVQTLVGD
jgi:hypothetical protein